MSHQTIDTLNYDPEDVDDNCVLPFHAETASANGRLVRLGGSLDAFVRAA